jgi:hypothetical protein
MTNVNRIANCSNNFISSLENELFFLPTIRVAIRLLSKMQGEIIRLSQPIETARLLPRLFFWLVARSEDLFSINHFEINL